MVTTERIDLTGYADRFVAAPGEIVRFMVSCDSPTYEARIVRLIHGDTNQDGPGFKSELVTSAIDGTYPGRRQTLHAGSYVVVPAVADVPCFAGLTLQAWVYPTLPTRGVDQGLLTSWSRSAAAGFGLFINSDGLLTFKVGDMGGRSGTLTANEPLVPAQWYFVAASFDPEHGIARLYECPASALAAGIQEASVEAQLAVHRVAPIPAPFLIGAGWQEEGQGDRLVVSGLYDGKIDRPRLYSSALSGTAIEALRTGANPLDLAESSLVAAWDLGRDFDTTHVHDTSANGLHGTTINLPARAVTDHTWTGEEINFNHAPDQYSAIHFHHDDLEDAGWGVDFSLTVPERLRSGVYSAWLRVTEGEYYIPFVVKPPAGSATADIAYVLPTFTYLAYADERIQWADDFVFSDWTDRSIQPDPADLWVRDHPEVGLSAYDYHADRSGCCFSSRLRPIPNMSPKYRMWLTGSPRHFSADLYLVDWMETKGFGYDVITDEDLHHEGSRALSPYRVVITGSHPEYWTHSMRVALEEFLATGGRCMYLGGNGWYWVTSVDKERPHVIEVRRGQAASRCWESAPGEGYHSTTGELGGIWRHRGKAPNSIAGVGFTAQGSGLTSPGYARMPDSFDPRVSFIFEGVGADEVIGEFGLVMGGAAGDELDRVDCVWCPRGLGTPLHTLVLATSAGRHTDYYLLVHEDMLITVNKAGGSDNAKVRADMAYFETANGGGMFSVGSINWMGSLSHNNYENNLSRVTENVLRRFIDPQPLAAPPGPDTISPALIFHGEEVPHVRAGRLG